ncbi:MAG: Ig-like domain-containing protein [Actinomycetes bacterium]|jgi:hypothetical protein|nr:Ig-like domain-containing protein [Actinomycetes bacterium]
MDMQRIRRKIVALCLVAILAFAVLPVAAFAAGGAQAEFQFSDYTVSRGGLLFAVFGISDPSVPASDIVVKSSASGTVKYLRLELLSGGGLISLKAPGPAGKATITLSSKSNAFAPVTTVVTVGPKIISVALGSKYSSGLASEVHGKVVVQRGKSFSLLAYAEGGGMVDELVIPGYFKPAGKTVTWKTSNKKVATVSKAGKVSVKKGAKAGKTVTITAKFGGKSEKIKLAVGTKKAKVTKFKVKGNKTFTLLPGLTTLAPGYSLSTKTVGTKSGYSVTTWKSSNKKVVTVDAAGSITTVGLGKATITAKAGSKSIKYTINVVTVNDI